MRRLSGSNLLPLDALFVGMGVSFFAIHRTILDEGRRLWWLALAVMIGYSLIAAWSYFDSTAVGRRRAYRFSNDRLNGRSQAEPPEESMRPDVIERESSPAREELEVQHG